MQNVTKRLQINATIPDASAAHSEAFEVFEVAGGPEGHRAEGPRP